MQARITWSGRPPAESLRKRLGQSGVLIDDGRAAVVAEILASDGKPRGARGGAWLWLPSSAPGRPAMAAAVAAGAYDVVDGSAPEAEVAARIVARLRELTASAPTPPAAAGVITESPAAKRMLAELWQAARTSMPVLLTGETGTGKEVSARLLHGWSARARKRFVPINCAAIPNDLLESELFGHARGAFSGAVQSYDGQIAAAEGGTVFLDEVDDTPLSFQVKLLRLLEDKVVSRLGENDWRRIDFRLIAATNRDLRPLIAKGAFGPDLYERLAIVSIRLPPLRDRREDIPVLTTHMMARYYGEEPEARGRHEVTRVTPEAMEVLGAYGWPGNIRELRNVVFGALVRKRAGTELLVSDLPPRLVRPAVAEPRDTLISDDAIALEMAAGRFDLRRAIEGLERAALRLALGRTGGNASAAAGLLGGVGRGKARDPGATVRAMIRRLRLG